MDILISSNLERLLYELTGHDSERVASWMAQLSQDGGYTVDEQTLKSLQELFWADFADDAQTLDEIRRTWTEDHYLLDPHTAVARAVARKYKDCENDRSKMLIISTASPFKFADSVFKALFGEKELLKLPDEFAVLRALSERTGWQIPKGLQDIDKRPVLYNNLISPGEIAAVLLQ